MTPEQLLQPRYEVIADYPESNFKIGQIISFIPVDPTDGWELADIAYNKRICPNYPNIFKPLSWWEHRAPDDMPEYVKRHFGQVGKATRWNLQYGQWHYHFRMGRETIKDCHISDFFTVIPATAAEYEEYLKSKK